MDNIKLEKISPLLSSAERIKKVVRKQRGSRQFPFKGDQQGGPKKKKRKKKGPSSALSDVASSKDSPRAAGSTGPHLQDMDTNLQPGQSKKIIDIRV